MYRTPQDCSKTFNANLGFSKELCVFVIKDEFDLFEVQLYWKFYRF